VLNEPVPQPPSGRAHRGGISQQHNAGPVATGPGPAGSSRWTEPDPADREIELQAAAIRQVCTAASLSNVNDVVMTCQHTDIVSMLHVPQCLHGVGLDWSSTCV
jgi:hypothetical protein